ncbi:hypothetical protein GCM10009001_26290 [Virgibacillus siamensis]|uniref:UvrD-like helicase ATP-binding domain-containing protein n=1 Tax=Virgibacillus siamensis TaxID=480071 RepID=A0ABN1GB63_9BACI
MIIDQNTRDEILASNHPHYLISASAGSGKTTILVEKAFAMIEKKLIQPYQQIAMITFTRLATRQIKDKVKELLPMESTDNKHYLKAIKVITTESFILSEVIKPFIRDAFGKEFPSGEDFVQNYNNIYKFDDFDKGLLQMKGQNVIGSYRDNNKNFTYQLGLEILKKSLNAQRYLKARFQVVMVDEYQDVDYDMHHLYMYLKDELKIRLVIVGDLKQMLYGFRGADAEIMKSLEDDYEFNNYRLIHNFRSHLSIVNYSYQFFEQSLDIPHEENRIRYYSNLDVLKNINMFISEPSTKDDAFVYLFARRNQWGRERTYWENKGFVFIDKTPLNSSYPNYEVLEPVLKLYFDSSHYNIYSMLDDLDVEIKSSTVRKAELLQENLNIDTIKALKQIEEITDRNLLEVEKQNFFETLDKQYSVNFIAEKPKKLALTIHSAKGLEFEHVFINADSFFDFHNNFAKQNHYVAITRAKESLHIVKNGLYESVLNGLGINNSI